MNRRIAALAFVPALLAACVTEQPKGLEQRSQPNLEEAARINTELGANYARQGLYDVATEKLRKAIDQNGRYAQAHTVLAYVYTQRGDPAAAEAEYRRALDLDGSDPELRNNFGVFLCSQGKTTEADRYFNAALQDRNYSTPEAAWTNAGLCLLKAGQPARAEEDFRQALKINAEFPEALVQMASLRVGRGDFTTARTYLQRYDRIGKPRPDTLLLWSRTERGLGDTAAAGRHESLLIQNYPESEEAAQLLKRPTAP